MVALYQAYGALFQVVRVQILLGIFSLIFCLDFGWMDDIK